jgi:GT2 family glycosyltransferase
LSLIIPTRNRPEVLAETLGRIGQHHFGAFHQGCELILIDNDSEEAVDPPTRLDNGIPVRFIRLDHNMNTGARNIGAEHASGEWLVMLDDDSAPEPGCSWDLLIDAPDDLGAIGGEITLPAGIRESGGLPEVIVGCGCVIRRSCFVGLGGYDASFGYYAEEYDLCARMIAEGYRIEHNRSLKFLHRKSTLGRDFNEILYRLVRNNAWVMQRYAPDDCRQKELDHIMDRYRAIAIKEDALQGFERACAELELTLVDQVRSPMDQGSWNRFTGRAAVRETLEGNLGERAGAVSIVGPSHAKGREIIASELNRIGCSIVDHGEVVRVVGSLSPGPMLDLAGEHPDAILPWNPRGGVGVSGQR